MEEEGGRRHRLFRTLTPPAAVPRFVHEGDSDILAVRLLLSYQKKGKLLNPALRQISWARLFPLLFVLCCRLARSLENNADDEAPKIHRCHTGWHWKDKSDPLNHSKGIP